MPTLLNRGALASPRSDPVEQAELDRWIPYEYILEWFRIRRGKTGVENRVLILKSETASGKSTLLPPEIYKEFIMRHPSQYSAKTAGLICTQPRTLTAVENVNEILPYNKVLRLGENIGWSTQYNKYKPRTFGLLSATVGTLTQQLKVMTDEELLAKYAFILIDETHERDLQTDMTIYMLKNFLTRNAHRQSCPFVVLMSATFDPDSFLRYFGVPEITNFIWCRGEAAGFTEQWGWYEPATITNYPDVAVDCVRKIVTAAPAEGPNRADILIFMPGLMEIKETWLGLHALNMELVAAGIAPVYPLRLDSKSVAAKTHEYLVAILLPLMGQMLEINKKQYQPLRRVIISTNIAETGLTLSDLKYVIDAGYNKEVEYNPVLGVNSLLSKPAPRSRITQRRGRAGRKFPGVFYPMYSDATVQKLPEIQLPQILLNDISPVFLDMIAEQVRVKRLAVGQNIKPTAGVALPPPPPFRVEDIDMIDAPTADALAESLELHCMLGFLDRFGATMTPMGELASKFTSQDPRITRMLFAAYYWKASPMDVASVAAFIAATSDRDLTAEQPEAAEALEENPRIALDWPAIYAKGLSFGESEETYLKFRVFVADDFLNGVILFGALSKFAVGSALAKWCESVNMSYTAALSFVSSRDAFIEQALTLGINLFVTGSTPLCEAAEEDLADVVARLKHCIYDGFRGNLLTRRTGQYYTTSGLLVAPPRLLAEAVSADKKYKSGNLARINKIAPKYLVYNKLTLKQNPTTNAYVVACDVVSAMDSFVSCDQSFYL